MQSIAPITTDDFKAKSNIVIGKVEIDSDGAGTYITLPDVKDISITTNIHNVVSRFCSYSFSITCLNTDDQFSPFKGSSPYYRKLKRGRKLKIYMGIKKGDVDYCWQWQLWIIDDIKLSEKAGEKICTIIGRNLMGLLLDYKLYYPNTFWGGSTLFDVGAGQNRYQLPSIATGVYQASVDDIEPRDGANEDDFSLLIEGQDFYYNKWEHVLIFGTGSSGGTFRTVVRTLDVYDITTVLAIFKGRITLSSGTGNCTKRGFYYGPTTDYGSEVSESGDFGNGEYSLQASGLLSDTEYHFVAFVIGADGNEYRGSDMTFKTEPLVLVVYGTVTQDKSIGCDGAVYDNVHDATEGNGFSGGAGDRSWLGQYIDGDYFIFRGFLFFDTSDIPSGAKIISAVLGLYVATDLSDTDFNIIIQNGQPTYPHNPLVLADFNKNYYSGNYGQVSTSGISLSSYTYIVIDPSIITKEGMTKLCIRSSRDISGIVPVGKEHLEIYTSNKGSGYKPILTITYEV